MTSASVDDSGSTGNSAAVWVTVTRTGGFAGLRRQWSAEADEHDAPRWVALIRSCPWGSGTTIDTAGADRFTFEIRAGWEGEEHAAELGEDAVRGPWRVLVDEVRSASTR